MGKCSLALMWALVWDSTGTDEEKRELKYRTEVKKPRMSKPNAGHLLYTKTICN